VILVALKKSNLLRSPGTPIAVALSFFAGVMLTLLWTRSREIDAPPALPPIIPLIEENAPDPEWSHQDESKEGAGSDAFPDDQMAFQSAEDDLRSTPIPIEWEDSLFAVLETADMERRNLGLIQLATGSAKLVPRIQAECLAHLTFALQDKDYSQFLFLARNRDLPLESRLQFLEQTFEIRRPEFSEWLAKNLASDPQPEISLAAQRFLAEYHSRKATGGPAQGSAGAF
jgi:hypothetical protein